MKVPNEIDHAIAKATSKKANYRTEPFSYLKSSFPATPQPPQQQRKYLSEL